MPSSTVWILTIETKNSKDSQKTYSYDFLDFDDFLAQPGDRTSFGQSTRSGQRPTRTRRSRSRPAPRMGEIYSKEILLLDFQRISELGNCL